MKPLFHTAAMKTLDDQIGWLTYQVGQMKKHIPEGVRTGKISLDAGHDRIECAESILACLIAKRDAEVAHG